jgi:pimeloyl-ACP methyl ester carboxylesterase
MTRRTVGLHYRGWGDPGGQTIVLVHGFSCSMNWWQATGRLLADRFRLVSVDLLGHGSSPASPSGYAITTQAHALCDVIREQGLPGTTLVGHSMGGHVCIEAAKLMPQQVSSVVLLDSPPAPLGDIGLLERLALVPGVGFVARQTAPGFLTRRAMGGLFAEGFGVPEALLGDARRMPAGAYPGAYREMTRYVSGANAVADRLRALEAPRLVLWGERDRLNPIAGGREMAARAEIPFLEVSGSGHSPHVERPAAVAAALEGFLGEQSPRRASPELAGIHVAAPQEEMTSAPTEETR